MLWIFNFLFWVLRWELFCRWVLFFCNYIIVGWGFLLIEYWNVVFWFFLIVCLIGEMIIEGREMDFLGFFLVLGGFLRFGIFLVFCVFFWFGGLIFFCFFEGFGFFLKLCNFFFFVDLCGFFFLCDFLGFCNFGGFCVYICFLGE